MHEYSVVSSLMDLCEAHARKHNATKIERVVVSIGERCAMDKHLFMSAFETFKEELEICKDAILDIVEEKVELTCLACGHVFVPERLDYGACERCKGAVRMSKGTEMKLLTLEML
ncbi:hydrogenase/urease nickel incorporation protein HypA [Helicobacter felis]|uniref:Hydrogenase maturation factor HypA n=1 Tax=Helicobacter felis (strain ATCC 49179 / CCUG 28539 / NCTC 12436 / CS1) TaxID=936155 RepID=E7A9W3_HELFC|nr:hydrogenase/urease nickel incorporation protein HypA [Helicobacter felis]CBY82591.1 hydrogenase/urease nickel incorporation protein, hydrogenase expression /formation protein [Helicobacter felis ATCC 49179]